MKTLGKWIIGCTICIVMVLVSCSKDHETGTMTIKLSNYSVQQNGLHGQIRSASATNAIYLDIRNCQIQYNDMVYHDNWVSLNTNAGVYNLYDLGNDATIVLVNEVTMPAGEVGQVRLILGSNNSVVINGTAYPLKIPSGEESGLKLNLNDIIHFSHHITVVLDFDPAHSVIELGNEGYILKPVIKVDVIYQD